MPGRMDEATEEQLRKMLRLLGTCTYPPIILGWYIRWARGITANSLSPAAIIVHMESSGEKETL